MNPDPIRVLESGAGLPGCITGIRHYASEPVAAGAIYGPETQPTGAEVFGVPVKAPVYRYLLWRRWEPKLPLLGWLMLNPSTATEDRLDPTLTRVQRRSQSWGYGGFVVANLFALRSPKPQALRSHPDPIGPRNNRAIQELVNLTDRVVCAWGAYGGLLGRADEVRELLQHDGARTYCLPRTRCGQPDPLYLPLGAGMVGYDMRSAECPAG